MPLQSGSNLGPYQIIARVGAGGMGEVYRARDTRLDRIVAIKVSLERFSERFGREARAIAALNHPHICQLYDVGTDYLVMEYVEGKPLSGPMALDEALRMAAQITEALDAAHRKGFVHRDLKPENILVTKAGGIKLLDFGLAKTVAANKPVPLPDETVTRALTQEGSIVGTLQYMSPEQLQGAEVDSRSDIFSFGAVFYEMLTGRRAFDGGNRASIVAAILTSEPPALQVHQPLAPPVLDRILRRCLAKDPDARWQSVRDLGAALACLAEGATLPAASPRRNGRSPLPLWLGAALLATIAVAGFYFWRRVQESPRVLRLTASTQASQYFQRPVISPDGSKLAYLSGDTSHTQVWVRSLSSFEAQQIDNAGSEPFWSPDSLQIAFASNGKLNQFDLTSGTRRVICDLPDNQIYGSWSSAGAILFANEGGIKRVSVSGGKVTEVTNVDRSHGELYHTMPRFLPDNRRFLFLAVNQRATDSAIYEGSIDSPQIQRVMASPVDPGYVVGKDLLFVRGTTLMSQPFDWRTAQLSGEPVSLHEHVYAYSGSYNPVAAFSAVENTLAFFPEGLPATELIWLDRKGNRISSVGGLAQYTNPALSPDQKQIAVGITDPRTSQRDVWLVDASGGGTRLTTNAHDDFNPTWSPDGAQIAFVSDRNGVRDLYIKPSSKIDNEEPLLASAVQKAAEAWSPDGKLLIFTNQGHMLALPVLGGRKPFIVVDGPGSADQAAISSDGKWIAYRSHDAGRVEVYIQRFGSVGTHWQVSTDGGGEPSWRRDGKELYFLRDKQLFAVDINVTEAGVGHGVPRLLFTAPFTAEIRRNRYVAAADGQRFLVVAQAEQRGLEAHIVVNWRAAVKKD